MTYAQAWGTLEEFHDDEGTGKVTMLVKITECSGKPFEGKETYELTTKLPPRYVPAVGDELVLYSKGRKAHLDRVPFKEALQPE